MTVTPDLTGTRARADNAAFARLMPSAAWAQMLEKAVAGLDQTWTPSGGLTGRVLAGGVQVTTPLTTEVKNPRTGPRRMDTCA